MDLGCSSLFHPTAPSSHLPSFFFHSSDPLVFPLLLYSFPLLLSSMSLLWRLNLSFSSVCLWAEVGYCWCCGHHNFLGADNFPICACFTWKSDNFSPFLACWEKRKICKAGGKNRLKHFRFTDHLKIGNMVWIWWGFHQCVSWLWDILASKFDFMVGLIVTLFLNLIHFYFSDGHFENTIFFMCLRRCSLITFYHYVPRSTSYSCQTWGGKGRNQCCLTFNVQFYLASCSWM